MPITPRSKSLVISSFGIFACSSISRTSGRICASANSRTLSRKICSSSASVVNGWGRVAVSWLTVRLLSDHRTSECYHRPRATSAREGRRERRQVLMRAPLIRLFGTLFVAAAALQVSHAEQAPSAGSPQAQQPPPTPPPAGQQAQDPQRQPTFRTGINFVRVDVIVSDKDGTPILDLKPEDFSVTEDGHPQKVEQFQVIKIDPLDQVEGPSNR